VLRLKGPKINSASSFREICYGHIIMTKGRTDGRTWRVVCKMSLGASRHASNITWDAKTSAKERLKSLIRVLCICRYVTMREHNTVVIVEVWVTVDVIQQKVAIIQNNFIFSKHKATRFG